MASALRHWSESSSYLKKSYNNEPSVYKSWDELFQLDPFLNEWKAIGFHYLISSNHKKMDYGSICSMCLTNLSS